MPEVPLPSRSNRSQPQRMPLYGAVIALLYMQGSGRLPEAYAKLRPALLKCLAMPEAPVSVELPAGCEGVKDFGIFEGVQFLGQKFYSEELSER